MIWNAVSEKFEVISYTNKGCEISVSKAEITILINVLKEVLRQIEPWEYFARVGMESEDGIVFSNKLTALLEGILEK